MAATDRIYGAIFCPVRGESNPNHAASVSATLWALERLPLQDDYPQLTRNLFALTSANYRAPGLYKELTIHFGATIKDVANDWDVWLDKLESFLEILKWTDARAYLELENPPDGFQERQFGYRWSVPADASPATRDAWRFEGGPRELGPVIGRVRDSLGDARRQALATPPDAPLLLKMIKASARLRRYDEACGYLEQLESTDPEAAKGVARDQLVRWSERKLLP
jgi:hypothetical protein